MHSTIIVKTYCFRTQHDPPINTTLHRYRISYPSTFKTLHRRAACRSSSCYSSKCGGSLYSSHKRQAYSLQNPGKRIMYYQELKKTLKKFKAYFPPPTPPPWRPGMEKRRTSTLRFHRTPFDCKCLPHLLAGSGSSRFRPVQDPRTIS